jgi:hypothetical protein
VALGAEVGSDFGGGEEARGEKARRDDGGGGEGAARWEKVRCPTRFRGRERWCAGWRFWGGAHHVVVPWWPGGRARLGQAGGGGRIWELGFFVWAS